MNRTLNTAVQSKLTKQNTTSSSVFVFPAINNKDNRSSVWMKNIQLLLSRCMYIVYVVFVFEPNNKTKSEKQLKREKQVKVKNN